MEVMTDNVGNFLKGTGEMQKSMMSGIEVEYPVLISDFKIKTCLDWVSHGNYSIHQDYPENTYINLEKHHFQEILNAWDAHEDKDAITPGWKGIVPARGMHFFPGYLFAYLYKRLGIIVIESRMVNFEGFISRYINQVILKYDDFKLLANNLEHKHPYHCMTIG